MSGTRDIAQGDRAVKRPATKRRATEKIEGEARFDSMVLERVSWKSYNNTPKSAEESSKRDRGAGLSVFRRGDWGRGRR